MFGKLADGVHDGTRRPQTSRSSAASSSGSTSPPTARSSSATARSPTWVRAAVHCPGADPLAEVDLGVVRLQPGAEREQVQARLAGAVRGGGRRGRADPQTTIVAREKAFWWTNTPIGFAFGAGVVLGFVVGMVICYQILASDVADHLPEYATLKAIGYPNRYLSLVVLQEALILAAAGFAPGMPATLGVYLLADRHHRPADAPDALPRPG